MIQATNVCKMINHSSQGNHHLLSHVVYHDFLVEQKPSFNRDLAMRLEHEHLPYIPDFLVGAL
jgi:hypothetical protein